jgi:hypothetical protein
LPLQLVLAVLLVLVVHTPSLGLLRVPSLDLLLVQLRPLMVLVLVLVTTWTKSWRYKRLRL